MNTTNFESTNSKVLLKIELLLNYTALFILFINNDIDIDIECTSRLQQLTVWHFKLSILKFKLLYSISFILHTVTTNTIVTVIIYFNGIKRDDPVDPIPGLPCPTGLYVIANSPK